MEKEREGGWKEEERSAEERGFWWLSQCNCATDVFRLPHSAPRLPSFLLQPDRWRGRTPVHAALLRTMCATRTHPPLWHAHCSSDSHALWYVIHERESVIRVRDRKKSMETGLRKRVDNVVTCSVCEVCFIVCRCVLRVSHTLAAWICVCVCMYPHLPGVVRMEMKAFAVHRRAGSSAGLEVWQTERGGAVMQHNQTDPTLTFMGYLNMRWETTSNRLKKG